MSISFFFLGFHQAWAGCSRFRRCFTFWTSCIPLRTSRLPAIAISRNEIENHSGKAIMTTVASAANRPPLAESRSELWSVLLLLRPMSATVTTPRDANAMTR